MNLQQKSIFIVAAILFVTLGVNTAMLTWIASGKYKSTILSKSLVVGEHTKDEIIDVLSLGLPLESVDDLSNSLKKLVGRYPDIGYAMVTDTKGKILFHDDDHRVGEILQDEASVKAAKTPKQLTQRRGAYYDLSLPLTNAEEEMVGTLRLGVKHETIRKQLYELLSTSLIVTVFSFVLSLGFVYFFISTFITRPITRMEHTANRIASGDLSERIQVKGRDEIASLGNAINEMTANLKDMVSKVRSITNSVSDVTTHIVSASREILEIAETQQKVIEDTSGSTDAMNNAIASLANNAGNLLRSSENSSSAILQMSKSIESISESSGIFSGSAQETASSIHEMAANIQQISQSLKNLSTSTEEISSSIVQINANTKEIEGRANESVELAEKVSVNASDVGLSAAQAAMEGMENIRNSVSDLAEVINNLGKRSQDIGKILNVISDVTEQTNLLSLNAAILAAQAGEHGRAFSVVADEIKSFAERTALSTREIEELVTSLQRETGASVRKAGEGIQTVEKGLQLVENVNEALRGIADSSSVSTDMSKAIQKATSQQADGIKQITGAIETVSRQVEQITTAIEEQERGSKMIINATEKMQHMSVQISQATVQQKDGSKQIAHAAEDVTQQADQIARTTNSQKERSEEIVHSMEDVSGRTKTLRLSANEMGTKINSLKDEFQNLQSELQKFKA